MVATTLAMTGPGVAADDTAGWLANKLALQMFTLRDYGTLEEQLTLAAAAGFDRIETVGDHGVSADELSRLLDSNDLKVIASHVHLGSLTARLGEIIEFNRQIGNDLVVLPFLSSANRPRTAQGWRELGEQLNEIGSRLRHAGLRFAYHNHDFELVEYEGQTGLHHLMSAAEPENLLWEADVAWIARAGHDPAQMLREYSGRVVSIHAKDNAPDGENLDQGGFADVGYGVLDWDRILEAAEESNVEWYIVEHDQPADAGQSIRRSRAFLEKNFGSP